MTDPGGIAYADTPLSPHSAMMNSVNLRSANLPPGVPPRFGVAVGNENRRLDYSSAVDLNFQLAETLLRLNGAIVYASLICHIESNWKELRGCSAGRNCGIFDSFFSES